MSNSVKVLYREIYRSDQSLPALIINIISVISAQLSNYFLYFVLIIYLRPCGYIIGR